MKIIDQIGREVEIPDNPRRIVSLVPSISELLWDLGLKEEIVGVTPYCIHPVELKEQKSLVGGTKDIDIEAIRQLEPELIIANKEENPKHAIETLAKEFPVWVSEVNDLDDSYLLIHDIGRITGKTEEAEYLNDRIRNEFDRVRNAFSTGEPVSTAYFIWRNPWMVAGSGNFINSMMKHLGLVNPFSDTRWLAHKKGNSRYPVVDARDLRYHRPRLVLLSSEPFPFKELHAREIEEVLPSAEVLLVDGSYFSWYGSRLAAAPRYFKGLTDSIAVN